MEAQSWNEEGEPIPGLSKVIGSSLASVLSILLMGKVSLERPCSGNFSRRSICLWVSHLDGFRDRYSGAVTVRTEAGDLNSLQISSKAPPSEETQDQ